jgi:hypothetical protein
MEPFLKAIVPNTVFKNIPEPFVKKPKPAPEQAATPNSEV